MKFLKADFIDTIGDFNRWQDIFNRQEIDDIFNWVNQCDQMGKERAIVRVLLEEIDEDVILPYYIWLEIKMDENGETKVIFVHTPGNYESLLEQPPDFEGEEFIKIESRAISI